MLDCRTRDRIGGISGIVSALMFAAGWAFWRVPGLPNMSSAIDVSRWFVEHQNACRVAAILGSLSLLFMIWFDVCLYGTLRKAEGGDGVATRAFFGGASYRSPSTCCSASSCSLSPGVRVGHFQRSPRR